METKPKKATILRQVQQWVKTHPRKRLIIGGTLLVAIAATTAYAVLSQPLPAPPKVTVTKKVAPKPVVVKYYSPLTGAEVKDEATTKQTVTAIMIENSPDARPQSGIKDAGIVFEAIAEGGITRFLTLHQENKPQLIGPVRSLRMYYVDWLAPFNASVAHIGGSAAALAEVRNGNYRDIDQFFNAGSYWRATDRYAPHNVYTSFEKLDALNAAKGYSTSAFIGFSRIDGKSSTTPTANSVTINFSGPLFNTSYAYDAVNNRYNRNLAGEPHLDREAGQITPSVVIALKVEETTVLEDGYRQSIVTSGSGEAIIFQNGIATTAVWTKNDRASQLVFKDALGKDIPLIRGQTWVSAIPNHGGSVTWQ